MKIIIISDIHINSFFSNTKKLIPFLNSLEADWLILNGDTYDLYLGAPSFNILDLIKNNPKIRKVSYIVGNHEFNIKDYFPNLETFEKIEFEDILITHGHQYDCLYSKDSFWGEKLTVLRNKVEKIFHINTRLILFALIGFILRPLLLKTHENAKKVNPDKKVIIGHTHSPTSEGNFFNCGGFVDGLSSYIEIENSFIKLKFL